MKNISADEITYKFKKNFVFLLFFFLVVFIVFSKTFDVAGLEEHKDLDKKRNRIKGKNSKYNKVKETLKDKAEND